MKISDLARELDALVQKHGDVRVQIDAPGAIYDIDRAIFAADEAVPTVYIEVR